MNKTRREITEKILKIISKNLNMEPYSMKEIYFEKYSQYMAIIIKCGSCSEHKADFYIDIY